MNRFNLLIDCIDLMLLLPISKIYALNLIWLNRYGTSVEADYSKNSRELEITNYRSFLRISDDVNYIPKIGNLEWFGFGEKKYNI